MNKTIRMITAAALSVCLLMAASCSKKEPENTPATTSSAAQTTAAPANSSETEAPASSETDPAPVIADNEQLEIIFKAKTTWYDASDPEVLYSLTDLDMNGLYEITSTKAGGTFIMWEVKADKSGVGIIDDTPEYGTTGPRMDSEYALRKNSKGAYEFIAREYDDLGSDEGTKYIYYWLLSFSNGKLTGDLIATEIHEEDGSIRYGDDEFQMTAEEFKSVTDTSLPKITCRMKINWGKGQTIAGINDAKGLESICFKIEK